MSATRPLVAVELGRVPYRDALHLQQNLVQARLDERIADHLLLLEHERVFTTSHRGGLQHLRVDPAQLSSHGIALVETDRGGDITYHGPGQLVGYLIARLEGQERSIPWLFAALEGAVATVLRSHELPAEPGTRLDPGGDQADLREAGVWVANNKICALGLKLSHWVTKHGFALNVAPDLEDFALIVACGLAHRGVTSMQRELGRSPDSAALAEELAAAVAERLGRSLQHAHASSLDSFVRASV